MAFPFKLKKAFVQVRITVGGNYNLLKINFIN